MEFIYNSSDEEHCGHYVTAIVVLLTTLHRGFEFVMSLWGFEFDFPMINEMT